MYFITDLLKQFATISEQAKIELAEFNLIGRLLTEKYFIELEERILSLQIQSAKERYHEILKNQPELLQRASTDGAGTHSLSGGF